MQFQGGIFQEARHSGVSQAGTKRPDDYLGRVSRGADDETADQDIVAGADARAGGDIQHLTCPRYNRQVFNGEQRSLQVSDINGNGIVTAAGIGVSAVDIKPSTCVSGDRSRDNMTVAPV